jgi:hypothetical protein
MVTKNANKTLNYPPMTIYVEEELRNWFKKHAAQVSQREGQPISSANIIRTVLRQYRDKIEAKKA